MDGVLVNLVQGCCDKLGIENPYYDATGKVVDAARGVYPTPKLLGLTEEEFLGGLDVDDWANCSPMDDAHLIVEMVEARFGKKNVCILSNPTGHESIIDQCMEGKLNWIRKHFPFYSNRFLFGPQKEFCAGNPNHVLIDDFEKNIKDFTGHEGRACLVPRPWNSQSRCNAVRTVRNFLEAL
jgi:hypothetical protein